MNRIKVNNDNTATSRPDDDVDDEERMMQEDQRGGTNQQQHLVIMDRYKFHDYQKLRIRRRLLIVAVVEELLVY